MDVRLEEKINKWVKKGEDESDNFDKYISYFIAFNILYNDYAKRENPNVDLSRGDRKRAFGVRSSISDKDNFVKNISSELEEYVNIIPVDGEEYWGKEHTDKDGLACNLKKEFEAKNNEKIIEYLFKWLYIVRCNIVHGDKEYDQNKWDRMLGTSSKLLKEIIMALMPQKNVN